MNSSGFSTGTTDTSVKLKLNSDAEVFPNPRTRKQGEEVVADNQGDVIFPPDNQDTGNLQEVTHDSSQDTTGFQQKVTLPGDATNSHQKVTLPVANNREQSYLPITQAGFRKGRSGRDNTFSLRVLMEMAIELKKELIVIIVDIEKAFDRISHAFLE